MGMYTELYLGVELKKDTREDIVKWLLAYKDDSVDREEYNKLVPKELDDTRMRFLGSNSYYFDAQPHFLFKWNDISDSYFLTVGFNIKNYNNEIEKLLALLEPYIESDGHIGHTRYEEYVNPTLLFMVDGKIEEYTNDNVKEYI